MDALLNLKRNKGATTTRKRLGRGNGSGLGTYSGRGGNGQTARTGGNVKPGFAGGQTPLYRKMPKYRGFNNPNRVPFQVINISDLNLFDEGTEINAQTLLEKNLISSLDKPVKLLGDGELTKKVNVIVDRLSNSAREKIENAKGTVTELMTKKQPAEKEADK